MRIRQLLFFVGALALISVAAWPFRYSLWPQPFATVEQSTLRRYEKTAFDAALAAGQPVVVVIEAPWCPACQIQHPLLAALSGEPGFAKVAFFSVDFDADTEFRTRFGVTGTAVILTFRDGALLARGGGYRTDSDLRAFLNGISPA
jgi:thiol-disulfide isomerase/thioredoxin